MCFECDWPLDKKHYIGSTACAANVSDDSSSNKSNEITIKVNEYFETIAQADGSILVKPKWIKLEDRLPNEHVHVLTYDKKNDEYRVDYIVHFSDGDQPYIWAKQLVSDWNKVTHWMPLPEPPKE